MVGALALSVVASVVLVVSVAGAVVLTRVAVLGVMG